VIYNRSHYDDVLVVRVHKLVPESVWSKRVGTTTSGGEIVSRLAAGARVVKAISAFSATAAERQSDGRW